MGNVWSKEVMAKNLRWYMEKAGKNQKEMAEIAGVSAPTFNEWLKAKKYPRIDKIERLADYFGILKSDLIEDKEKPANDDGLTAQQKELMQIVGNLPADKQDMVLRMMKALLEGES